jgi:hypothetical protein
MQTKIIPVAIGRAIGTGMGEMPHFQSVMGMLGYILRVYFNSKYGRARGGPWTFAGGHVNPRLRIVSVRVVQPILASIIIHG